MTFDDDRIFRSFEEFEREELRQMESVSASVDEMIDSLFREDLAFDAAAASDLGWGDAE